ncbi:NADP-dependent 3-hydroxy acid dehydrogenase YdfG [Jatrophihabitans sp. GAS493]|uniref:SDR family NAD(P)-dependent oxidoreductase n=1 Tax=Jatrophihabitans sp. GAS493 TaxID=1907575 RepID=UPI000BB90EEE|nr:SDR family NAD(P)-dependent oxidoreductase [Jatrophihabitans sp. GAS493]SOD74118.1 NADP-dependent 3-hydroxy acid dehydrogenase YdfG [Jatrophihabitans sp. GAS493]
MTGRLDGTSALVTGASSGIGAATALTVAAAGARVALVARRVDRLADLADKITELGSEALVVEADVNVEEQVRGAVQAAIDRFGRLDTVIANAGVMLLGPIVDAPVEEWERMVNLNILGLMYTTHAALPHLLSAADNSPRGVADLVMISSVAGRQARLGSGAYNASKHAVGAFAESLRQEVTQRHVRVGLIEPGAVATELAGHNRPEILEGLRTRFSQMQRLEAEDIAETIEFMLTRPRRMAINEMLIRPTEQQQ